ncbi:MAG: YdcF family protein [Candidatus Latescibacterota bacterium]
MSTVVHKIRAVTPWTAAFGLSCAGAYLIIGAFLFQRSCSCRLYNEKNDLRTYDLVIVFAGGEDRIPPAFELLRSGRAKRIIISPASQTQIEEWSSEYLLGEDCACILETKSTSTHENAYYCADIIRRERARSIILVTSWYHIRRSCRLLSLALRDYPAVITCCPTYPDKTTRTLMPEQTPAICAAPGIERFNTIINYMKFLSDGLRIRKSSRFEHRLETLYETLIKKPRGENKE